ncbi:MAG: LPS-assembly protein LptD, partial [Treponema sp.]|nr:LPS-assembly protein LptD [Treponema sp.]
MNPRGVKKRFFVISIVILCLSLFPSVADEGKATVVTIKHARHTEYEKNEASGNEIIVLTGNVSMSVEKGMTKLYIDASTIRYDRKTCMLFAQGDVVLKAEGTGSNKDAAAGNQDATADSMLLNTDTLEGIFDNSRVVRYGGDDDSIPGGSTLVASSSIMGTGASGSMAFKHATISFCDDDNPHWKIRASKAWMLPGGEFAFLNALLYVGPVPLLYLPAFYYPKDELIFNPVMGFDARRGYFVQTTTYLWGRKPLSAYGSGTNDGSFNFGRPSRLKEQEREGIVLHNLDADYDGQTKDYLKLTADYYTRLGGMVGLDGNYTGPSDSLIPSVSVFFDLGFSNTVFYERGRNAFSRYGPSEEGWQTYRDSSSFLTLALPFRYAGKLSASSSWRGLDYSLSFPVYSDPYFLVDYGSRNEYMDWINFMTRSSKDEITDPMKATDEDSRTVSSFSWDARASYSFPDLSA